MKRKPIHPGEILREEFMADYGLTVKVLAEMLGVSRQTVNDLVRERRGVSPEMALRLAICFGNSPEQWLNMQRAVDLWEAEAALKSSLTHIKSLTAIS
jgi:addiction module HigA family antidote